MSGSDQPPDISVDSALHRAAHVRKLRAEWIATLTPRQTHYLLEFEALLRGVIGFANPLNHPGPRSNMPAMAHDYRPAVVMLDEGLRHLIKVLRKLLGELDKTFVFHRYIEAIVPEDITRSRMATNLMDLNSPEGELMNLRRVFSHLRNLAEGLSKIDRLPHRYFESLVQLAQVQVRETKLFNPIEAPGFHPSFGKIRPNKLFKLIDTLPTPGAKRLVRTSFRTLFRLISYTDVLSSICADADHATSRVAGRLCMVTSALTSEARTLASTLTSVSSKQLAESYGQLLQNISAEDITEQFGQLRSIGLSFLDLRSALESLASSLRLEMHRLVVRELPPMHKLLDSSNDVLEQFANAALDLKPSLQNLVLFLAHALGDQLRADEIATDERVRTALASRLRAHVWMFQQIVRAFLVTARESIETQSDWTQTDEFGFVFEFVRYFESLGYPLLRTRDRGAFRAYLRTLRNLSDNTKITAQALRHAVDESEHFYELLGTLFDEIGNRTELSGVAFDKVAAGRSLSLYLGIQSQDQAASS